MTEQIVLGIWENKVADRLLQGPALNPGQSKENWLCRGSHPVQVEVAENGQFPDAVDRREHPKILQGKGTGTERQVLLGCWSLPNPAHGAVPALDNGTGQSNAQEREKGPTG